MSKTLSTGPTSTIAELRNTVTHQQEIINSQRRELQELKEALAKYQYEEALEMRKKLHKRNEDLKEELDRALSDLNVARNRLNEVTIAFNPVTLASSYFPSSCFIHHCNLEAHMA
ncbi:hypothetical protein QAD02_005438 [Eretmocerus hayati]|uniref:Uncharacterized protein n=2 Tax=Eretmocerus hayati TaxID=131215 RepID=A0ACC2NTL2_9HYME|nr:hypothetical protein QAD02_004787 [Eretmocerus hayati]KAJ8674176.1 hypothetical protein QAD02_005438 [Eretmocerus hayati]